MNEHRATAAAGVLCTASVGLSIFASLTAVGVTAPQPWTVRMFGPQVVVEMTRWNLQAYRTEIVALALALLAAALWSTWRPSRVPPWLRLGFLIAALLAIFAADSDQIARDILGRLLGLASFQ